MQYNFFFPNPDLDAHPNLQGAARRQGLVVKSTCSEIGRLVFSSQGLSVINYVTLCIFLNSLDLGASFVA